MKKFIISLFIVGLTLTACEKTYIRPNGAISFGTTSTMTKATANVGPNNCGYDQFNVFSKEAGMNPYTVQWNGSAWTYDGIGTQTKQHFDKSNDEYNFIAVISDKAGSYANSTVTVQDVEAFLTNDEANTPKEFLWAGTTVARTNYSNQVSLAFAHGNAKMYIGFASDRNDTEILDYVPERTTPGTTIPNKQESLLDGTAWAATSTAVGAVITQDDINYINGLFTYNSGLVFTYGDGVEILNTQGYITGYFQEATGIKDYLISKYPTLASVSDAFMNRFTNFYLIHIEKNGNEVCGWFYNKKKGSVSSVTAYSETTTPGTPIPAIKDIRVFSVSKDAVTNKNVRTAHTTKADANITTTSNTFVNPTLVDEVITFDKPDGTVVQIADKTTITLDTPVTMSPSVWYAIPVSNTAYVVKFSYIYNGVTKYDARVLIPATSANFGQSEYYKYVIYITDSTGGSTNPDAAADDKDEVDTSESPIIFNNITFGTYHGNLIII